MPRRVQDIIPANHRSIRKPIVSDVTPVKITKKKSLDFEVKKKPLVSGPKIRIETEAAEEVDDGIYADKIAPAIQYMPVTPPTIRPPKRKIGKWSVILVALIVFIVGSGYVASVYYSRATFTIVPKVIPVSVNGTYVASANTGDSSLSYEIVTVQSSATSTVVATNGPITNTKATGKLTLYNVWSVAPIRLIAGTKLITSSGLVYKLTSSVVIPGYTKPSGTVIPGKVAAGIIADQAGQNFNVLTTDNAGDFRILAYKDSAKESSVYGRLITNVSGGFSGVKKIVSQTTIASTTASLKANLTAALLAQVKTQIPNGYIMYDSNYSVQFFGPDIGGGSASTATVAERATMYGIIFRQNKLIDALAGSQSTALFGKFGFTYPGLESLQVSITNLKDFSPSKKVTLVLHVKGTMKLVGTVPVEDIRQKLAGISLAGTQEVFKSFSPVIESGSGELAPPWAKIPTDLRRITVTVKEP